MGRAPCCDKNGLKKGPWMPEEDDKLIAYIQTHGPGNWRTLPKNAGLQRCGKSCRLRWTNYLRPDIKRGRFSFEEEETIIQLHSVLGNKWSAIAARLPGRTDNEIKNYWNTHIRKRLLRNGIDPVTHAPRLDLMDLSSLLSFSMCNPSLLNLTSLLKTQALLNPELLRVVTTILPLQDGSTDLSLQSLQENHSRDPDPATGSSEEQPSVPFPECLKVGDVLPNSSGLNDPVPQQSLASPMLLCPDYYFPEIDFDQGSNGLDEKMFGIDSFRSTPVSGSTPMTSSSTMVNTSSEDENGQSCCSNYLLDLKSFDMGCFI
ncbi:hypothetical protein MLD38_030531 [Melastoma candidum]|uniref:Uncharacterized protein n=1 Tax=Melastoma candidum TaxID=119954 RepID=A0ACB9MLG3_9MYRT|nr:hypothetical protein MLD38_030531 [Melastoma candidum]